MKWKQLFKPHIFERGMEYYYAGCVEALEADDEQITAVVEGTEDYDVLIHLDSPMPRAAKTASTWRRCCTPGSRAEVRSLSLPKRCRKPMSS